MGNFFLDLCESTLTVTSQNCLPICGFSLRQFGGFSRHILYIQYLDFFSDIKTLSARSGTTVQSRNFSFFCAELCMHATLLIIVGLFSDFRCWIVHHLSFQVKKAELIYLHYRLFYNCSCILVNFLCKKRPKRCAHC